MSEALVAELGKRVDMDVPASILRELGSQEYQAKLLEAQAKAMPSACLVPRLCEESRPGHKYAIYDGVRSSWCDSLHPSVLRCWLGD